MQDYNVCKICAQHAVRITAGDMIGGHQLEMKDLEGFGPSQISVILLNNESEVTFDEETFEAYGASSLGIKSQ